jgi:hypothetical protein
MTLSFPFFMLQILKNVSVLFFLHQSSAAETSSSSSNIPTFFGTMIRDIGKHNCGLKTAVFEPLKGADDVHLCPRIHKSLQAKSMEQQFHSLV